MCIVHLSQCQRAKAKTLGEVEPALIEHFGKLWDYGKEIRRINPGSTVKISVEVGSDNRKYFQRLYVCLRVLKTVGCRGVGDSLAWMDAF